ncbi:MAG: UDP-N-acetylmuramate--L-alanine ligase [Planctomycetes bacterium]|nr:UDP-N-acetylmuramate--L-alanine ligase [Planctomycetota bacterium]
MSSEIQHDPEARPAALPVGGRVHFIGIGGIGMSAVARQLVDRGHRVSGSDAVASSVTEALVAEGIDVHLGHAAKQLPRGACTVVTTAALTEDNPELQAARRRKLRVLRYGEALDLVCRDRHCVAIAGTHGKTTTTAMIAWVLKQAGLDPGAVVGGIVPQLGGNVLLGRGPAFVTEACEYAHSFLHLRPRHAVITNVGDDHLDFYRSLDRLRAAFRQFVESLPADGLLVTSSRAARDLDLRGVLRARLLTLGAKHHDVRMLDRERGFQLLMPDGERSGELRLRIPGRHNRFDAALAATLCRRAFDLSFATITAALAEFEGVERRFRVLVDRPERSIVDDYAHHPAEVEATLLAARERFPDRRLVAVFQPHLADRVRRHRAGFLNALAYADEVEVLRDYQVVGRDEADRGGAAILSEAFHSLGMRIPCHADLDSAFRSISARPAQGEVFCIMGAGDIGELSLELARALR